MDSDNIRDIELLNTYRDFKNLALRTELRQELVKELRKEITGKLGQDESVIEKRLAGLDVEDEFMLMALVLGDLEQITRLEQKQFINWAKYGVPDFLVGVRVPRQLMKGKKQKVKRFFVEVKKAKNGETDFVLPLETLARLRTFSKLYTLPLYFAVKIKAHRLTIWFLLSNSTINRIGTPIKASVRGKKEDCVSVPILEMLKEDSSGLWLSNHQVLIQKGFRIVKRYRDQSDSQIYSQEFGKLAQLEVSNGIVSMTVLYKKNLPPEDLLRYCLIENLRLGERRIEKVQGGVDVINEAAVNYLVTFYHLLLQSYLDIREKFESVMAKNPNQKPTISYFLQNFSEIDRNIAVSLRNAIWEMCEKGIFISFKTVPSGMPEP